MKAALQQAGIAGAADLGVQWNLVKAGVQDEIDLSQTAGAAAGDAVVGAVVGALTPPTGNAKSSHVRITPEGPPQHHASSPDVKIEGTTPVASGPDAQSVTPQEAPGSPVPKNDEPVPTASSSDAQAEAPQETPVTSQVPGKKDSAPIFEAQPPKATTQGVAPQEVPGSPLPKSDELAPSSPTAEAQTVAPQEMPGRKPGQVIATVESEIVNEIREEIRNYDVYLPTIRSAIQKKKLNVSEESAIAIHHYTGPAYEKINRALREGFSFPGLKEVVSRMTEGIRAMPVARGEVWRAPASSKLQGDMLWNQAVRGKDLDLGRQFQSFSGSKAFAERRARQSELLLYVREPKGGAYIADISKFPR